MFHTSRHADSVLGALSQFMQHDQRVRIQTPSGASMLATRGLFAAGAEVMAPGIDDCSPRRHAVVISTGEREGWSGRWCLVRYDDRVRALLREEDLIDASGEDDLGGAAGAFRIAGLGFVLPAGATVQLP